MARRRDTIEVLRKRRDAWAAEIGGSEYAEDASRIVRELDEQIEMMQGSAPITEGMENRLRQLTRNTVIDRDNDVIEGDVGLSGKTARPKHLGRKP